MTSPHRNSADQNSADQNSADQDSADQDSAERAAFRAFVRRHHPDVGGDPETFRRGLDDFRCADPPPAPTRPVLADDDPRLNAPITAVSGDALHRLGRAGQRFWRRHPLRRGSSRVL